MSLLINKLTLSIATKIICKNLNMCVNPGEFWGVMGINGAGKTTLLKSLIGLYDIDPGNHKNDSISLNNKNIYSYKRTELAQKMGMMFQEYEYNFPCTVIEATLIGRHPFLSQWQIENIEDQQLALNALKKVGLEKFAHRAINTLSGGEKRRVNLATLLTQNPDYLLLDEPINHLDLKAQIDVLTLLKTQFKQSSQCGVMVIHDPNLAYRFCDHMLLLFNQGQWLAGDTKKIMTTDNLSRLYACKIEQIGQCDDIFFTPNVGTFSDSK